MSKVENLYKAFDNLTSALAEFDCQFLSIEMDCSKKSVEELAQCLRDECACDCVSWKETEEGRFTVSCTTATGLSEQKD